MLPQLFSRQLLKLHSFSFRLVPGKTPKFAFFSFTAILLATLISGRDTRAFGQNNKLENKEPQRAARPATGASDVARGKYLVEGVAMCGVCHTPRDHNGNLDRSRWLQGAPMAWLSPNNDPNWPLSTPRIGGTPPASDADMVKLLTTGVWTTGNRLRFPMPQFRMDRADAEAVIAYLKQLTPQQ